MTTCEKKILFDFIQKKDHRIIIKRTILNRNASVGALTIEDMRDIKEYLETSIQSDIPQRYISIRDYDNIINRQENLQKQRHCLFKNKCNFINFSADLV